MKKRLDKQEFAKLVLNIYTNFLRMFQYDCFYDIARIKALENQSKSKSFHLYFRRTGSDILFDYESGQNEWHVAYLENNPLVLHVVYSHCPHHNQDVYEVEIIKDKFDYMPFLI